MIVLKSIPLSLSVFWRFLVVLPLFVPIALAVVLSFSLVLPFLAGVFSNIALTFATLVAIRAGFQAQGVSLTPVFSKLFFSSVKWGLFETVVYAVLAVTLALLLWLLTPFGPSELGGLARKADAKGGLEFVLSNPAILGVALVGSCLIYGLAVAFSVPKAAAAYSAGEKVRPLEFLWGFGSGFFSIAVVIIASGLVSLFSGALLGSAGFVGYAVAQLVSWLTQNRPPEMPVAGLAALAGLTLLQIWSFCWIAAACALAFLQRLKRLEAERERMVPAAEPVDLRALRKSRE
jgi:hypothetical protein